MKGKILAAALSTSMGLSALTASIPVGTVAADSAATGKVIYSTDFEDGDVSLFTNRGGDDTTELSASEDFASSGSKALLASGRSESWNGPAFRLDTVCEPNTQYYVSAKIKGRYYTNAMLSFQYSGTDGKPKYSNLVQNLNGSDWITVTNAKVSFTEDMTDVYVYFEGGDGDMFIDDFSIVEVPAKPIEEDIESLSDVYAGYFRMGTALTPSDLSSKSFMALAQKHLGDSVTVGNEMKPDSVLDHEACLAYFEETGDDTTPQISFSAATPVLNYAKKNNIPVRIHTLVWHSQTPNWFFKEGYADDGAWVDKDKMLKRMENYIKAYFETLEELYPEIDFYACDVVNEAWLEDGNPRQPGEQVSGSYEKSAWVKVFGDNSFIEPAFTYARKYAPEGCKLYYNDYNEYMDGKLNKIIEMATDLKEKGLIDGIGMQSHLDARQSLSASFPSPAMYKNALAKYAATGLDIQITELDATVPDKSGTQYFDVQAEYYSAIFDAIVEYKDYVSAVIFWGITDDISWRASQNPLIFDADFKAKPAYYSIIDDVERLEVPSTQPTTQPTSDGKEPTLLGDANCDEKVNLADAILIMQVKANPSKYTITQEGAANADVVDNDGITNLDALEIQKYLLGLDTVLG